MIIKYELDRNYFYSPWRVYHLRFCRSDLSFYNLCGQLAGAGNCHLPRWHFGQYRPPADLSLAFYLSLNERDSATIPNAKRNSSTSLIRVFDKNRGQQKQDMFSRNLPVNKSSFLYLIPSRLHMEVML